MSNQVVHITCGICGEEFQSTEETMKKADFGIGMGHYMATSLSCSGGGYIEVKMSAHNKSIDICPKCAYYAMEKALESFKKDIPRLMKTPMTHNERPLDG